MMKVQQKVSGTFRSREGADAFCRIMSFVSTARKLGRNACEAIADAFRGVNPIWMAE
jgi:transposase